MNINFSLFYQLIVTAIATALMAHFLARLYIRYLKTEALRYKIEFNFNHAVVYNENLQDPIKNRLIVAFQASKKSFIHMLLSGKPLKIDSWYNREERDAFFSI